MNSDSQMMGARPAETSAQRYRDRSKQLLEAARLMASGETKRDTEWVARRYEAMAISAEQIEGMRLPAPALRLR